MQHAVQIANTGVDSETVFRTLVALGTVLTLGDEVKQAANTVFGVRAALANARAKVKEPRIQRLTAEIEALL